MWKEIHMTYFIGIDPGKGGAVGILDENSNPSVFDTPTYKNKKTGKDVYDLPAMAQILRPYAGKDVKIVLEAVHSMPGQGVSSSFNFGEGLGIWKGIIAAFAFKVNMTTPQTWKKTSFPELIVTLDIKDNKPKTPKEKKELGKLRRDAKANAKAKAREVAKKLFPALSDQFKTVNSDGRAEALLIAVYASKNFKEI
jgi:crossover junction endodeoxyribonuclease RuvC